MSTRVSHQGRCLDHFEPVHGKSTLSPGSSDNPKRQAHGIIIWMLQVELETEVWDFCPPSIENLKTASDVLQACWNSLSPRDLIEKLHITALDKL